MDQISHLPEDVIGEILSYLPLREAVAAGILSKTWQSIIRYLPILCVDQSLFEDKLTTCPRLVPLDEALEYENNFIDLIAYLLSDSRVQWQNFNSKVLSLRMQEALEVDESHLKLFLEMAMLNNFKKLYLYLGTHPPWLLPKVFSFQSLLVLHLNGCDLCTKSIESTRLDCLQELQLDHVNLNGADLSKLLDTCPHMVNFRLKNCQQVACIRPSSHLNKLEKVCVVKCSFYRCQYAMMELKAPALDTFHFHGLDKFETYICINNEARIYLEEVAGRTTAHFKVFILEDVASHFRHLKSLFLCSCPNVDTVKISSELLESLSLLDMKNLVDVTIDTPNLLSFKYSGNRRTKSFLFTSERLESLNLLNMEELADVTIDTPNLRSFEYFGNRLTKSFVFTSERLESLSLLDMKELVKVTMDTPNLCSFEYSGNHKTKSFLFTSVRLKSLSLLDMKNLVDVTIRTPNLLSFEYSGNRLTKSFLLTSERLESLSLLDTKNLVDVTIDTPNLLSFEFCGNHLMKSFLFTSKWLERLSLLDIKDLVDVKIYTPNLRSFEYSGNSLPKSFLFTRHDLCVCRTRLTLTGQSCKINVYSLSKLSEFSRQLCYNNVLSLYIKLNKVKFLEDEIPVPAVSCIKQLDLDISGSLKFTDINRLVNCLFASFRPDVLSMKRDLPRNNKFIEVLCDEAAKIEKGLVKCCEFSDIKCWRHYLENFQIEEFGARKDYGIYNFQRKDYGIYRIKWKSHSCQNNLAPVDSAGK